MRRIHIDLKRLILYYDGELPATAREQVEAHLRECEGCRKELLGIRSALPRENPATATNHAGNLLKAIRHLETKLAAPGKSVTALAAAKLASFLGPAAAKRVLEPVPESGENLVPAVEPVLAAFLGRKAGAELAGRVALDSVVRL